ncbi:AMP-binding protein [Bordetella genomosp. 12]|uniref:Acyl-CoA synthetase n=1 Tax=Bordetella genomosp. 12 TaxID=463035 RepID=A0A261VFW1_9BORD|nr:AMP-binding protein [Bordetella genomosp. 12]OZI72033.1 acyl-CoA synthetase [Bordetella genomosp. 12]
MNFHTLIQAHAARTPQRIAFQDQDRALDYAGLLAEVERLSGLMHEHGARRGERLALWMPNCIEWLVTFLACARLGMTVVAVNTRFREHEVGQLLARGRCTWLAMWPDFKGLPFADTLKRIDPAILRPLRGVIAVGEREPLTTIAALPDALPYTARGKQSDVRLEDPGQESDGALVYTTSGTTSAPKLVLHRQAGLIAHGHIAAQAYGIDADSIVLLASPLCGAFGFSTMLAGLTQAATLVSLAVFDAAATARQIREHGVTHTFANNEFIDHVLRQAEGQPRPYPSLRYVGFASFSPAMDDLPERARQAGLPIAGLYGSSELQALVAGHRLQTDWPQRRVAGGTIAAPEGRVRAIDPDSGAILPHGAIGQIEIKAPSLMAEYLDDPEATRKAISADGFFRTGDLGYTLDERLFIFQGRDGDHLRLGGFLVSPLEIEQFIEALPGVAGAQVVGAQWQGKTVAVAFVRRNAADTDERAIIDACQTAMAKFKVPHRVIFVEDFPMVQSANSNKVQKHVLRQQAQAILDDRQPPT